MCGLVLSTIIALLVAETRPVVPLWLRQAISNAISIAVMVKLGITHPPAGAASVIFASGEFGWTNMVVGIFGNVLAIGVATIINNISIYRQYPTFWGLAPIATQAQSFGKYMSHNKE
jgi:CBS-domain-containing membrane protein